MTSLAVVDEIPAGHGAIGLLSADEFLPPAEAFDRALLDATGPRVGLLFCADPRGFRRSARLATAHYERLGAEPIVLDVLRREQATADALPEYDVLLMAGGSPSTLIECLRETPLWDEALRRWRTGSALAGSSAGAMALCRHCLLPRQGANKPTVWGHGLGPLHRFALAVHASSRPDRWLREVASGAPVPLVAMDDHAGLILRPGSPPQVAGHGRVWTL